MRLITINEPMSRFLRAAIQAKLNIMFSGATGAGKTATLNVLSHEIAPDARSERSGLPGIGSGKAGELCFDTVSARI